jgi:ABC-type transport system involved in cytochrome c biogenesis permease subunit
MGLFIEHPALAAAIGALFLVGYWVSRRPTAAVAAAAWLVYGAYETGMRLRWLCSGECNIRLDLLAIYPLLLVLSLVALIALARGRPARRKS